MTAEELDPQAIREALTPHKRRGIPFDLAWTFVVGPDPRKGKGRSGPWTDHMGMRDFMRKHFRAAYLNLPTANGRWAAPDAEIGREPKPRVPLRVTVEPDRCKSSERCGKADGHGVFGSFCAWHAAELAPYRMKDDAVKVAEAA